MFVRMLKLTVVLAMLMVFAVFPAGVLFSGEPNIRNYSLPPKKDLKCEDHTEATYKDKNNNNKEVSGCVDFDADQSTCEAASLTREIKQSKGCTETGYGFECTEKYMDTEHGDVIPFLINYITFSILVI